MLKHAKNMEFEQAAKLRDKIKELQKFIEDKQILSPKK